MLYIGINYAEYFLEGYVLMSLNLHSLILEIGMLYHDVLDSTCCQNKSLTDKKKGEKRFIRSLFCVFSLRCKR